MGQAALRKFVEDTLASYFPRPFAAALAFLISHLFEQLGPKAVEALARYGAKAFAFLTEPGAAVLAILAAPPVIAGLVGAAITILLGAGIGVGFAAVAKSIADYMDSLGDINKSINDWIDSFGQPTKSGARGTRTPGGSGNEPGDSPTTGTSGGGNYTDTPSLATASRYEHEWPASSKFERDQWADDRIDGRDWLPTPSEPGDYPRGTDNIA